MAVNPARCRVHALGPTGPCLGHISRAFGTSAILILRMTLAEMGRVRAALKSTRYSWGVMHPCHCYACSSAAPS